MRMVESDVLYCMWVAPNRGCTAALQPHAKLLSSCLGSRVIGPASLLRFGRVTHLHNCQLSRRECMLLH